MVELIQSKLQGGGRHERLPHLLGTRHRRRDGLPGCRNETVGNPAIFTSANLAQYDAIFWQASSLNRGDTTSPQLFTTAEQQAIEEFARAVAASARCTRR